MHARIIQSYLTFEIISFKYFSLYKKKDLKEKRLVTINTGTRVGPKVTDVRKLYEKSNSKATKFNLCFEVST